MVTLAWVVAGCSGEAPSGSAIPVAAAPRSTTNTPAAATSASSEADYKTLVGRWARSDGDYTLLVHGVDETTGRLQAEYLNPSPIHVGQATFERKDGKLTVFVELQDVNYPGCTYRLTYFPRTDQLYGVYYQAALQQSYDVEFERVK